MEETSVLTCHASSDKGPKPPGPDGTGEQAAADNPRLSENLLELLFLQRKTAQGWSPRRRWGLLLVPKSSDGQRQEPNRQQSNSVLSYKREFLINKGSP